MPGTVTPGTVTPDTAMPDTVIPGIVVRGRTRLRRRRKRRASAAVVALLFTGCGPDAESPELRVEYSGCAHTLGAAENPSCTLAAERRLRLWVAVPADAELEVEAGGQRLARADAEPAADGLLFRLSGLDASRLTVRATRGTASSTWELALGAPAAPGTYEAALDLYRRGERRTARQRVDRRLASDPPPAERARLIGLLGQFDMAEGEPDRAAEHFREAARIFGEHDHLSQHIGALTLLFRVHFYDRNDVGAAWQALGLLPAAPQGDADSAYLVDYYRGTRATYSGEPRSALRYFGDAVERSRRLGLERKRFQVTQMQARQWSLLGRYREASVLLEDLENTMQTLPHNCDRAELLNNIAWNQLLTWEATADAVPKSAAGELIGRLRQALELFAGCKADQRAHVHLNLALLYLRTGEASRASEHLAAARALKAASRPWRPRLWHLVWLHDIEARIALHRQHTDKALALYGQLAQLAAAAFSPDTLWRAMVGQARVYEASGRRAQALEAVAEAEALLDEESLRVPVYEGREASVGMREAGTRLYIELLLRSGRTAAALDVARRARTRVLRGLALDARLSSLEPGDKLRWAEILARYRQRRGELEHAAARDWQTPRQLGSALARDRRRQERELRELLDQAFALGGEEVLATNEARPPPEPGEVILAYHPLPQGWVGFAGDASSVEARRLGRLTADLPRQELAERLLAPFAARISRAARVRVLPYGFLRTVDFHALPFEGDVLLRHKEVVYALDLPTAAPPVRSHRALLIADPTATLLHAAREVERVEEVLVARGWQIDRPPEPDAAVLRRALASAELFHFSGHADFSGRGGWASDLRLAAGSRLLVGDILTTRPAPRTIVLSACESGRSSRDGAAEGIGLAQAFLLAGSSEVLGAVRPVDDRATALLMAAFYDALPAPAKAATALRRAQLALRHQNPTADWASFRIVER